MTMLGTKTKRRQAFTLAEVTMCVVVAGVIFTGILTGYVHSARSAERSERALAVLGLGTEQPAQARAASDEAAVLNEVLPLDLAWTFSERPLSSAD